MATAIGQGSALCAPLRRHPLGAIAVWGILVSIACASSERHRPNVIVIMADDMGYGDVGCYNPQSKIPTPHMDRLAAEGMRFTDAHSPSAVCTPTRYGLMTGRYCWRTRLKSGVFGGFDLPLIEDGRMTLGSLFQGQGYATSCIGKWHLGLEWVLKKGEKEQEQFTVDFSRPIRKGVNEFGFDYFFGTAGCTTDDPPFCFLKNDRTVGIPDVLVSQDPAGENRRLLMVEGWRHEDADIRFAREAVQRIEENAAAPAQPFFLYLAPSVPHIPWLPPDSVKGKSDAGPRGDQVVLLDVIVGQITETLDRCGIADNTLLIVTSDNGPREGVNGHASSGILRGGKGSIWEGGHRVPFIVRWPRQVAAGSTNDETISLTDLMATFVRILETTLPEDAGEDSCDISPYFRGENLAKPIREATIHHSGGGVFAIRQGPWKLIAGSRGAGYHEGPEKDSPGQLYHLDNDPRERTNLWDERQHVVARLSDLLERYRQAARSRLR